MPTFQFIADPKQQLPVWATRRFSIYHSAGFDAAKALSEQQGIPTPGINYQGFLVSEVGGNQGMVLAVERVLPPTLSKSHVNGAQPMSQPRAQPGQNAPAGPRDHLGFEPLADVALNSAEEAVYGEWQDGTYTDMINVGGAVHEIPRDVAGLQRPPAPQQHGQPGQQQQQAPGQQVMFSGQLGGQ